MGKSRILPHNSELFKGRREAGRSPVQQLNSCCGQKEDEEMLRELGVGGAYVQQQKATQGLLVRNVRCM